MLKTHRSFVFLSAGMAAMTMPACHLKTGEAPANPPNIVYVFPDQFRKTAMGFWQEEDFSSVLGYVSDPVHTPNLDRFARESIVLSEAVSNFPLSSPHRGMLLSGRYPEQNGITLNCNSDRPNSSLRDDITCLGDVFRQAGYNTGYIGKYHANHPTPNDPQRPGQYVEETDPVWDAYTPPEKRHGFEYWYSYGTFDVHKNPHYWDTEGKRHEPREFSPRHEADKAIAYIQNKEGQRDGRKPFLLVVSMNPPHSPYSSPEDVMEEDFRLYKDIPLDSLLNRPNVNRSFDKRKNAPYYFANVTAVDREFGRILQALKEEGLDKNTIVVFTSDHGETMCSHLEDPKNSPYAESFDVPFLIRYPDKLRTRTDKLLMGSPDIMPTLIGLAGFPERIPSGVQGTDFSPYLLSPEENRKLCPSAALYIRNTNGEKAADGKVYSYHPAMRGVKTERYTFAVERNRKGEEIRTFLFDNREDPYQLHNIPGDSLPEVLASLRQELNACLRKAGEPELPIR